MTRILILLGLCFLFGNTPCRAATVDAELHELMRAAFPGWAAGQTPLIQAPGPDAKPTQVAVAPRLVLRLDDGHHALIVSGVQVMETGMRIESHGAAANLGVYVFEQRDGRWTKTHETPSAGWTGFFGEPGTLRRVELGAGRTGLAVENNECWQGFCGAWLTLFAVTTNGSQRVLHVMTGSSSVNTTAECGDWLNGKLRALPEHQDAKLCFDIASRWQPATAPDQGQADIVLQFTGHDAKLNARTGVPSVRIVRETLVLRQQGPRYEVVSGHNPTHSF